MITVRQYAPSDMAIWNDFNAGARNGLFIFNRGFMDYHSDRFSDCSLIVSSDEGVLALMPAHRSGTALVSHGGLTFGGLILGSKVRASHVISVLESVVSAVRAFGIRLVTYKQIPPIFYAPLSGEDSYALFRIGARQVRVDANFVVDMHNPPLLQDRRRRSAGKARKAGVSIVRSRDFAKFWSAVLIPVLSSRHGVAPVHSVDEIELLHRRFPENISLVTAVREDRVVAGVVLFQYGDVTHSQYIAANDEGREVGALDLLFSFLLGSDGGLVRPRFFSFGVSTEQQGRVLNEGLAEWKEGFGARAFPNSTFEIDI